MLSKLCVEDYLKRRVNYAYDLADTSVALEHLLEENGIDVDLTDSVFSASIVEEENDKVRLALGKKIVDGAESMSNDDVDKKSKILDIVDKKIELIKELYLEIDTQIISLSDMIYDEFGIKINLDSPSIGDALDELQEVYDDVHSKV